MNKTDNYGQIYCSTSFAAKKLGVSTTTLQKLADEELFLSWKTPGGHRRINLPSLVKYMEKLNNYNTIDLKNKNITSVLLIDEDENIAKRITNQHIKFNKTIKIFYANSLIDLLVKKLPENPDLLLLNMKTNSKDKVEFLKMMVSTQPQTAAIAYNFKRPMTNNRFDTELNNITIINDLTEEWYYGFLSCLMHFNNKSKSMSS